jgi:hypothetical protein
MVCRMRTGGVNANRGQPTILTDIEIVLSES